MGNQEDVHHWTFFPLHPSLVKVSNLRDDFIDARCDFTRYPFFQLTKSLDTYSTATAPPPSSLEACKLFTHSPLASSPSPSPSSHPSLQTSHSLS